jgi:hypothetical protein
MWDDWRVRIWNKIRQNRIGSQDPANRVSVSMAVRWYKNLMWQHRGSPIDTILYTLRIQQGRRRSLLSPRLFLSLIDFAVFTKILAIFVVIRSSPEVVFLFWSLVLCGVDFFFFLVQVSEVNKELDTSEVRTPNPSPYLFAQMFLLRCQPPALEEGFCTNIHRELRSNKSLGKFGIYMWCAQCRVVRSANPSWQALGFQLEGSQRAKSKKTSYILMNCVVWCSRCADFRVSTRVCI